MLASSGRIRQSVRPPGLEQELRHVQRANFGGLPIGRTALCGLDLDRRDALAAKERIEMLHPLFAVEAYVEIDAVERATHAHRIGAMLQHGRRPRRCSNVHTGWLP